MAKRSSLPLSSSLHSLSSLSDETLCFTSSLFSHCFSSSSIYPPPLITPPLIPTLRASTSVDDEDFHLTQKKTLSALRSPPLTISLSTISPESHHAPPASSIDFYYEDEFERIHHNLKSFPEKQIITESDVTGSPPDLSSHSKNSQKDPELDATVLNRLRSSWVEIVFVFLSSFFFFIIAFISQGRGIMKIWRCLGRESSLPRTPFFKKISACWEWGRLRTRFVMGQMCVKFYASGRRFCTGLLATMELKRRLNLISRMYNMVVPSKDEIHLWFYMNDDAMNQVVFIVARKNDKGDAVGAGGLAKAGSVCGASEWEEVAS